MNCGVGPGHAQAMPRPTRKPEHREAPTAGLAMLGDAGRCRPPGQASWCIALSASRGLEHAQPAPYALASDRAASALHAEGPVFQLSSILTKQPKCTGKHVVVMLFYRRILDNSCLARPR